MDYLSSLIGKRVQINRGGHEAKTGRLLDVKKDFVVLQVQNEGVVYFAIEHMKSCSEVLGENQTEEVQLQTFGEVPTYIAENDLVSTLGSLIDQWVQLNRGGHDKIDGVLARFDQDYVTILTKKERVRVHTQHIKSFNVILMRNSQGENQAQDQSQNSQNNSQNNSQENSQNNSQNNKQNSNQNSNQNNNENKNQNKDQNQKNNDANKNKGKQQEINEELADLINSIVDKKVRKALKEVKKAKKEARAAKRAARYAIRLARSK